MPRRLGPAISPDNGSARVYSADIRRHVVNPFVRRLEAGIKRAGRDYFAIRQLIKDLPQDPALTTMSTAVARKHINKMAALHKKKFTKRMSKALGVDIRPILSDTRVAPFIQQRIIANVDLIKTIPARLHNGLKADMAKWVADTPFDRRALQRMLAKNYKSTGYNLRRLTRDQSNKLTGALTQIRQQQVGVTEYVWRTANDERVRDSHIANNETIFAWDSPPQTTGHTWWKMSSADASLSLSLREHDGTRAVNLRPLTGS